VRPALTQRQRQALQFITDCLSDRGYPPTLREIGEHMGIRSTNGVNDHLKALERKGYLVREELKSRARRPLEVEDRTSRSSESTDNRRGDEMEIAILGRVAAGEPILAEENVIDRVVVDRYFLGAVKAKEVFGLVVRGESMIDAGIFDGDFAVVRPAEDATDSEIVVALVGEEATVKRFFREADHIRLQPENQTMEPIRSTEVTVLGRVIGVLRKI
jgi:repressor LexA